MKHLVLLLILASITFSCGLKNKYRISGQIKNGDGKWLFLDKLDVTGSIRIDSVKLNDNGNFRFKGARLTEPTFFKLSLSDKNYLTLLTDSTEKITVNGDAKQLEDTYNTQQSLGSGYIKILNRKIRLTKAATDSLVALYGSLKDNDWARKKEVEEQYLKVIESHKKFVGSFVMENPRSFASYYALLLEINNAPIMNVMDKKDQVFYSVVATSLNLLYPESERVKQFYNHVLTAKNIQRREKATQMLLENAKTGIPNIEAPQSNGEVVSLESLRGKLVLLSYWSSIDQNSRYENRNLKRLYAKYKSKGFEIYQVSLDQSKILWENAILQDGITWINVSDLQGLNSYPARIYNINTIPSNYLISRNGDIIGKDLFGSRLEEKLSELLK